MYNYFYHKKQENSKKKQSAQQFKLQRRNKSQANRRDNNRHRVYDRIDYWKNQYLNQDLINSNSQSALTQGTISLVHPSQFTYRNLQPSRAFSKHVSQNPSPLKSDLKQSPNNFNFNYSLRKEDISKQIGDRFIRSQDRRPYSRLIELSSKSVQLNTSRPHSISQKPKTRHKEKPIQVQWIPGDFAIFQYQPEPYSEKPVLRMRVKEKQIGEDFIVSPRQSSLDTRTESIRSYIHQQHMKKFKHSPRLYKTSLNLPRVNK